MKKCKFYKGYIIKKHPMGKNYLGICLFGIIFSIRPLNSEELNHELIHAAQQKELLYIPFFIWYGLEWLVLYCKYKNWMTAYYQIRFEEEAYKHQSDYHYLKHRKHYRYK
jgi:hypothetical protein